MKTKERTYTTYTPIAIQKNTTHFESFNILEDDKDYLTDVVLLTKDKFAPRVFRGVLIIAKNDLMNEMLPDQDNLYICCRTIDNQVYARKLPDIIKQELKYDIDISYELFNRLEVFMISGIDCIGKTVFVRPGYEVVPF